MDEASLSFGCRAVTIFDREGCGVAQKSAAVEKSRFAFDKRRGRP
jgi:hypothetical protein